MGDDHNGEVLCPGRSTSISGEPHMQAVHELHQRVETPIDSSSAKVLPSLQRQWSQLGQALLALEHILTDVGGNNQQPLTPREKKEKRQEIRRAIIAQLYRDEGEYSRDVPYLAFLLVKQARGGEIVGNPSTIEKGGSKQEHPYTGLEGYYAGSQRTSERPGMTCEEIIQEEAKIGAELLTSLKKYAIENYSWADFARLKHILAGQEPDREELRTLQLFWTMILKRLHVRIYHNPEFEPTLTEKMEQVEHLLRGIPARTEQEKQMKRALDAEYHKLMDEYDHMSKDEQEKERQERQTRERIRADRLEEFHQFREATYEILAASGQGRYVIRVQDASPKDATITEAMTLPDIPQRSTYSPTPVHLTPEQLEGYLFLAHLGEVGGSPLARSILIPDRLSYDDRCLPPEAP
jgi:hypothetical protein